MPVTARLSRLFYDRLGEEVVNELVDWLNAVDATYRADLRQLNELNFGRFDATLEQRITALDSRMERRIGELEVKMERRIGELETRVELLAGDLDAKAEKLHARIDLVAAELRGAIEKGLKEQTRWMFVAWGSLLIPIIGLWMRG